ncbi:MAG: hypothetical protein ACD_62C00127G0012 [uncultured bacterium]|nr:MAG: hypothetical protein ACD_62C00127G0012 [uncultured bacterium]
MHILIADKVSKSVISGLEKLGAKITLNPELSADDLPKAIGDAQVLIVRSTKVTADTISAGKELKLIIRAGAGVNTIDVAKAKEKGVFVSNCPGTNSVAVAELAMGLLIACDRQIANANSDLRGGKWRKGTYQKARGLKGRTLGIVGFGHIGQCLAQRAKAFEMNLIAFDPYFNEAKAKELGVTRVDSLEQIFADSDAVSLHLAFTPQTKHLVNMALLAKMKNGAILINASRGEIIETSALKQAIKEKGLRVGLDVYENEPADAEAVFVDTELATLITGTPHIGASTDQASDAVGEVALQIVQAYKETGKPIFTV